jgi:hypothetical protein
MTAANQGDRAAEIVQRAATMKSDRAAFEGHWEEVRRVVAPDAGGFVAPTVPGEKTRNEIVDSAAEQANEEFGASVHSMVTNPVDNWLTLGFEDEDDKADDDEKAWMETAQRRCMIDLQRPEGGFTLAASELYGELGPFGTACLYIGDPRGLPIMFSARPLGEIFIAENAHGRVDTVFRRFELTARQAVQEWGDAVGEKISKAATDPKSQDVKFPFIHAVYPRADRDPRKIDRYNKPLASCWVNQSETQLIAEGGFDEIPYAVPRWLKRPGEVYGRGPGMKVLPDAKMLQRVQRATIRGAEKMIDPPLMIPDDGVGKIDLRSGGLVTVRQDMLLRSDPIRPIVANARPDFGEELSQGIRERIQNGFYKPLMMLARDPRMTASQFLGLQEESFRILSPFFGRILTELLAVAADRVFGINLRRGRLGMPPASLANRRLRWRFISPIAKAHQLAEARGIVQTVETMAPIINADPAVLDNLDADKAFRRVMELTGVPFSLMRPIKQRDAIRQARQEVARLDAMKKDALELSIAAKNAGQAVPGGIANAA